MSRIGRVGALFTLVACAVGLKASAQTAADSATSVLQFSMEGMHRSNSLTNGFLRTMLVGGKFEAVDLEAMRYQMERSGGGVIGLTAGGQVQWIGSQAVAGHLPRLALETRGVMSASATHGLFGLVFQGNAPDLGAEIELAGTTGNWMQWSRLAVGIGSLGGNAFLEVGAYRADFGGEFEMENGGLFVSEGVDLADVEVDAHLTAWENRGWGLGLSARHQWGISNWWAIELRDFGAIRYGGEERFAVDTGLVTTGLPWEGPGWTVEGLQEEEFGDGLLERKRSGVGWQLLPARFALEGEWACRDDWTLEGRLEAGGWMPKPLLEAGVEWKPNATFVVGIAAAAGGWGGLRPVLEFTSETAHSTRALRWEDPVGSFSAAGRGRGMELVWSRKLASMERHSP
jgi:hypothetical protein